MYNTTENVNLKIISGNCQYFNNSVFDNINFTEFSH